MKVTPCNPCLKILVELDVKDDLSPRLFIQSLDKEAAPHRQVGTEGRTQHLDKERLVLDKTLTRILGDGLPHHLIPCRQQSLLLQGSLQSLMTQYLREQFLYRSYFSSKHENKGNIYNLSFNIYHLSSSPPLLLP